MAERKAEQTAERTEAIEVTLSDLEMGMAREWAEELVASSGPEVAARVAKAMEFLTAQAAEAASSKSRGR